MEEVATAFMTSIKGDGISGHKAAHHFTKRSKTDTKQQMKMPVRHREPEVLRNKQMICKATV